MDSDAPDGTDSGLPSTGSRAVRSNATRLAIIQDLAINLLRQSTLDHVLQSVIGGAIERLGFHDGVIYLWEDEHEQLVPHAAYCADAENPPAARDFRTLSPDEGIVGAAFSQQVPIRVDDTARDDRYIADLISGSSELAVPILYEGRCIGVIDSEHPEPSHYTAEHEELMVLVASLAAPKIDNLRAIERLESVRQELSTSRNFIREMIDTAPNVLYVLDYRSKTMIEGRQQFAEFFGFSAEEIDAMPDGVYSLIHPEDVEAVADQERQLSESPRGTVVPVEFRLRDKSGDYLWCLVSSKIFAWDRDGRPMMEVGSVMDISSVKSAESALQQHEKQIRALFENCFDCIVLYDQFATVIYSSPSAHRFTGYTESEIVGQTALDFTVEEDHAHSMRTWFELLKRPGGHAILEQRIRHKDGRQIWIEARLTNRLDDPNVRGVVSNFHDITDRKIAEQQIFHLANYDSLTDLPNRRLLMTELRQRLDQATETGVGVVLMYMDLDRFKNVNDTLGHDVGDRLLKRVAATASRTLGDDHLLARLGGDEFAVVMNDASLEEGRDLARRLVSAVEKPFALDDYDIRLTASVGVVRFPQHGCRVDELFKHADIAMYRAKTQRNRYAVFQARDAHAMETRVALEKDLQHALEDDQFELWYQPRIDLESGNIVAVEALLRWQCPSRGLVLPGEFIPVAEETGLIYRIGEWVLNAACSQASTWREEGRDVRISVNLSARELLRADIVSQVSRTLVRHDLPGNAIELELTETAAMTDLETSSRTLEELRQLGVRLAIDDFGTGHSSLSYLRQLPVDYLKIDQSFLPSAPMSQTNSQHSVITGIVLLAESVGLSVVAEGVETQEQHRFLKSVGCDEAQGYYYARPKPPQEVEFTG